MSGFPSLSRSATATEEVAARGIGHDGTKCSIAIAQQDADRTQGRGKSTTRGTVVRNHQIRVAVTIDVRNGHGRVADESTGRIAYRRLECTVAIPQQDADDPQCAATSWRRFDCHIQLAVSIEVGNGDAGSDGGSPDDLVDKRGAEGAVAVAQKHADHAR
jgi:hypothetical protein